jgi:hypothetical protein
VERAEEAGRHGLAHELPQRGRVVREAEVGDENPGEVGAGDGRALPGDDAGQVHRPHQQRVPARLRRLDRRHHPPLQVAGRAGGDQPCRIRCCRRRRHGGAWCDLAEGLGLDFVCGLPPRIRLRLAGSVWKKGGRGEGDSAGVIWAVESRPSVATVGDRLTCDADCHVEPATSFFFLTKSVPGAWVSKMGWTYRS